MSLKKFIAIVVVIVVVVKLVELFVWQTPVELGKGTTYITEPLAADGLPNYALAILQKHREGVTPENNAAVLMWQAIGPVQLDDQDFARVCRDLGMATVPEGPYLEDVAGRTMKERITQWLRNHADDQRETSHPDADGSTPTAYADDDELYDSAAKALASSLYKCPWTEAVCPPMATWVEANEQQLDLLVRAAAKPRFYSTPPNMLVNADDSVIAMLLPHAQYSREVVRALVVRANYRTAKGDFDPAWQDILACWRFGEHVGHGPHLVENLVGIAIRGVTMRGTIALLSSHQISGDLGRGVLMDLEGLSARIRVAPTLDQGERFSYLDAALRVTTDRLGGIEDFEGLDDVGSAVKVDSNIVLRQANKWYDRLVEAASIDDRQKRRAAIDQLDAEIESLGVEVKSKFLPAIFSRTTRSELIGDVLTALMLPAVSAAVKAEERDQTVMQLTRVVAALAVFRAEHGEYPDSLAALAPAVIAAVPIDPYSGAAFVYQRRGTGFLLYSVHENGVDDGGDDLVEPIVDGEWLSSDEMKEFIPPGMENSDLVIRVPLPPPPAVEALLKVQEAGAQE